ncbi:hypothetical protein Xen7305DRAFT_00001280 [Xenococcus sp. PCC 7305]|uniref:hypothetical protein n=1 Tax=Xenococcus sp. PCC 7305 TaxID=102125 RepID=UPI0002ABAA26|nr:hypothetical protein [Xenococcus sp. PCC 7305]ELS00427.1 hypothetical protein Xen7305DRAFT_00001280 [Xenococcus sp. PCC 7305]
MDIRIVLGSVSGDLFTSFFAETLFNFRLFHISEAAIAQKVTEIIAQFGLIIPATKPVNQFKTKISQILDY